MAQSSTFSPDPDLPVNDSSDVLATLPDYVQRPASAPIRDAIVEGETAMFLEYQDDAKYAADQSNVLTATGIYLQSIGEERGVFKQDGETDTAYRTRILATPSVVTPTAIMTAVNAILAPYTTTQAQYCESIQDRWFVTDGTLSWHSCLGVSPSYYDRLYPGDSAVNGGYVRPNSEPGHARVFSDIYGRLFVLRVPTISSVNAGGAYMHDDVTPLPLGALAPTAAFYIGDGSTYATSDAFIRESGVTDQLVYQQICNTVEALRGASIRWLMIQDTNL